MSADVNILEGLKEKQDLTKVKKPKYQMVCDSLREALKVGEYAVGAQLPSQDELSTYYGVSLLTVRQAISVLEGDGLLSREHGRGTFVKDLNSSAVSMRKSKSNAIAMILVGGDTKSSYHRAELGALEQMVGKANHHLLIASLTVQDITHSRLPAALRNGDVAGVLLENYVQDVHVEYLRHHGFPVVVIGSCALSVPVANVNYNQGSVGYLISKAIGELDKGPIYFLTEPFKYQYTHELFAGYRKACKELRKSEHLRTVLCETKDPYSELREIINDNDGPFSLVIHANIAHALRDLFHENGLDLFDHPVAIYGAADYVAPRERERFNLCGQDILLGSQVAVEVLDRVIAGEKIGKVILEPELVKSEKDGLFHIELKWHAPDEYAKNES